MNGFTPRAQKVIQLARKEAERFNHPYMGTEHLLLGLIALNEGVAVSVLEKMGVDLETLRLEVEKTVGHGPETKTVGNLPFTPRSKKVTASAPRDRSSWAAVSFGSGVGRTLGAACASASRRTQGSVFPALNDVG